MTNAEIAILGLVAENERYGYEIEQIINARDMRDWTDIAFSSIYYLLNKLEKGGLVKSRLQQIEGKGPARKIYHITEAGFEVQMESILALLSAPQSGASPFLLGLANYPMLPKEKALAALEEYASQIEERLKNMLHRAQDQQPLPPIVQSMFDYSQSLLEAEFQWINNFIKDIEVGNV